MALRIAFDLDGTIADMDGALAAAGEQLFGTPVHRCIGDAVAASPPVHPAGNGVDSAEETPAAEEIVPPPVKLDLTARQTSRLWRHVQAIENFWETLAEIEPGAIARLASVAAERHWEIIFLTRRPATAGATAQVQTQRWLESKGFPLPSVFVVQHSRGRIAAALGLDIVVDDRPENCLDVVTDSRARAILVRRDEEKTVPAAAHRLGIGTVKSIAECLDVLVEIDTAAPERPGVIARVKRMLGLSKEPAPASPRV